MAKTLIITAHVEHLDQVSLDYTQFDQIICADGGLLIAREIGLSPTYLIGDYDSMEMPDVDGIIKLPMEKDMTDTEAAIDLAVDKGASSLTILGGLGGRFDHTMGNIGMLAKYSGKLDHIAFVDGQNYVFMLLPGKYSIPANDYTYLGVISYGCTAEDVTLRGVKYPLTDYRLNNDTSLGVSNEIVSEAAEVSFSRGKLLIVLSKDVDKKEK